MGQFVSDAFVSEFLSLKIIYERENERTNEFFINEGKGISTIYFFSSSPRAKKQKNNNNKTTTKTIENKIIINSKTHINY